MAKRFTDTNKYKKAFMRSLPGAYKLFWDFLYHDCDHSGIWIVDFQIAQSYLGEDMPISKEKALELFNEDEERIVVLAGGKKWFIPSFIEFQYGQLAENNRAHKSVIMALKKLNLLNSDLSIKTPKAAGSPLHGVKEKEMDKEQELDMDKDFGKSENLLANTDRILPQMVAVFKRSYPRYPEDESDFPSCLQIAHKIAKYRGWMKEAVANDKMPEIIAFWTEIVQFSVSDKWFSQRSISDFNKEFQRLIQKKNSDEQQPATKNPKANGSNYKTAGQDVYAERLQRQLTELNRSRGEDS